MTVVFQCIPRKQKLYLHDMLQRLRKTDKGTKWWNTNQKTKRRWGEHKEINQEPEEGEKGNCSNYDWTFVISTGQRAAGSGDCVCASFAQLLSEILHSAAAQRAQTVAAFLIEVTILFILAPFCLPSMVCSVIKYTTLCHGIFNKISFITGPSGFGCVLIFTNYH